MKNNLLIPLWVIILSITLFSCEQEEAQNAQTEVKSQLLSKNFLNLDGYVLTSNNVPLGGVIIKNRSTIIGSSDENGHISLGRNEIAVGDVLNFEHEDFVTVTKVIRENTKLVILMKERDDITTINSSEGGRVSTEEGAQINIPPNAFSLDGQSYTGEVEIQLTYIDVTDSSQARSAPGSYIAIDTDSNNLVPLESFGMIEISAVIPGENLELQLQEGSAIQVSLPILNDNTPETVRFYELDRDRGYWVLIGQLRSVNYMLIGEVTTVNSTWNADEPCADSLVCVKIKVVNSDGTPSYCGVDATGATYAGSDGIYSIDANGYVQFMICPNEVFQLGACWILCCVPGNPPSCCDNPQYRTHIDMSTVTVLPGPDGCIDLGTWTLPN